MRKKYKRCILLLLMSVILLGGCAGKGAGETKDGSIQETGAENTSPQEAGTENPSAQEAGTENTSSQAAGTENPSSSESEELPTQIVFEGQDMDGNVVSSSVFLESKITMVNVWATYCNPCLREMPGLGELAGEYDSGEFQIIGIVSDVQAGNQKELANAADLIERTGANYTHLLLNESLYYALLTEVTAVPTTFFIDENGVILDTVVGAMEKSAWEEKINALLEEQ